MSQLPSWQNRKLPLPFPMGTDMRQVPQLLKLLGDGLFFFNMHKPTNQQTQSQSFLMLQNQQTMCCLATCYKITANFHIEHLLETALFWVCSSRSFKRFPLKKPLPLVVSIRSSVSIPIRNGPASIKDCIVLSSNEVFSHQKIQCLNSTYHLHSLLVFNRMEPPRPPHQQLQTNTNSQILISKNQLKKEQRQLIQNIKKPTTSQPVNRTYHTFKTIGWTAHINSASAKTNGFTGISWGFSPATDE